MITPSQVPLEWFVLIGTFIQGVLSLVPMFVVLVPAGAVAQVRGEAPAYLALLAVLAGLGRICGAIILYWLSVRLGEYAFRRRRSWFGIDRASVDRLSASLGGPRAWISLFAMWAIPVFPGAPITIACGLVRMPMRVFITATFCGATVGSLFYLGVGYLGLQAAAAFQQAQLIGSILGTALAGVIIIWLIVALRRRHRAHSGLGGGRGVESGHK